MKVFVPMEIYRPIYPQLVDFLTKSTFHCLPNGLQYPLLWHFLVLHHHRRAPLLPKNLDVQVFPQIFGNRLSHPIRHRSQTLPHSPPPRCCHFLQPPPPLHPKILRLNIYKNQYFCRSARCKVHLERTGKGKQLILKIIKQWQNVIIQSTSIC